jgi:SecD/SecF fusion protein
MNKTLTWKFALIAVIIVLALWLLYPPDKTLKPGLDIAGGASLIYEIDTEGMDTDETKDLSSKMITILRRRIDPANIQNLVWRPHGSTRFEIQMPLASAEARQKRNAYNDTLQAVLGRNINTANIMHSLAKPAEQRVADFNNFAQSSSYRQEILANLTTAYDQMAVARDKEQAMAEKLRGHEEQIETAGLDMETVADGVGYWIRTDTAERAETLKLFLGKDYSQKNLALLAEYTALYQQWARLVDELTDPDTGKSTLYKEARRELAQLSLTEEQLKAVLDMPQGSAKRNLAIDELKAQFPDRTELINSLIAAYDEYRPFKGRLDDPEDIKRMLKGAGILEFRILPTQGQGKSDTSLLAGYVENLKEKGPKFASDAKYTWLAVEEAKEWLGQNEAGQVVVTVRDHDRQPAIVGEFAGKVYVLASNKPDEIMLHDPDEKPWKLSSARSTQDRQGRRAIGFTLDERGGRLFGKITGNNISRPLCIILDGMAISAPSISTKITRDGIIQGRFTKEAISDMVDKLRAGSLPAMLIEQPVSEKTIGPMIGQDNRDRGIQAGIIGLVVVIACMLTYYLISGGCADVALLLNILIILAAMAWLRATFTLPGIAGFILTIGMSVDANVLIFERIREEQLRGSSLRIAINNGYQKAFRTIFDANVTTFITAAILFWVAPEEIKGFAIVLMLGIGSSMFTALFVTRAIFDFMVKVGFIKDKLVMLRLIRKPNVDWMALRPVFLVISTLLITGGLLVFFTRDDAKNNKYDIEFTGGTVVQINLKKDVPIQLVRDRVLAAGNKLNNPALAAANVYSVGELTEEQTASQFEINTTETNKTVAAVTFTGNAPTVDEIKAKVRTAQNERAVNLTNLLIVPHSDQASTFSVSTSLLSKATLKQVLLTALPEAEVSEPRLDPVVNNAVMTAFADLLQIRRSLEPSITGTTQITEKLIEESPELLDFLGGVKITCKLDRETMANEIERRIKDLRFKPDMRQMDWYTWKLLTEDLTEPEPDEQLSSFVYVSVAPDAGMHELSENQWGRFVKSETTKVLTATQLAESLPRVTQVNPSIGAEAKTQAMIAIVLSLFAIVGYVWVRFGNIRYGLAAIAALMHDVCITLGAVTACTYIAKTGIGQALLIGDFKISQVIIAAFLTLIGYSLNDTIVVFDRIRENRRKAQLQPSTITDSINQTISRTVLTSFTTFVVVLIMYIFGGQSLRGFTFAIGLGIIIGTYSSIAIAAPLLLLGSKKK